MKDPTGFGATLLLMALPAVLVAAAVADRPHVYRPPPASGPLAWRLIRTDTPGRSSAPVSSCVAVAPGGVGVACGGRQRRLLTRDGGLTWEPVPSPHGWTASVAVGEDGLMLEVAGPPAGIFRSTDTGATWARVQRGPPSPMHLQLIDGSTGVAVAFGFPASSLLVSRDSGRTWEKKALPVIKNFSVSSLAFVSPVKGWVLDTRGRVLRTTDGGATWASSSVGQRIVLRGIAAADAMTVVAVGAAGGIYRSADGGASWQRVPSGTRAHLKAVTFTDPLHGVAVGYWGTALATSDGGLTWGRENTGTDVHLLSAAAAADGSVLAGGSFNTILRRPPMVGSND